MVMAGRNLPRHGKDGFGVGELPQGNRNRSRAGGQVQGARGHIADGGEAGRIHSGVATAHKSRARRPVWAGGIGWGVVSLEALSRSGGQSGSVVKVEPRTTRTATATGHSLPAGRRRGKSGHTVSQGDCSESRSGEFERRFLRVSGRGQATPAGIGVWREGRARGRGSNRQNRTGDA